MKIIIEVNEAQEHQKAIYSDLEIKIDINAEMHFRLNNKFIFRVNCQELETAIRAFNI